MGSLGNRLNRFAAAYGSTQLPGIPWVMIDGGHQFSHGIETDYYQAYKNMVDTELARPPLADVSATFWREGNHFGYEVAVKNLSGVSLSYVANGATVTAIVYEDVKSAYGVQTTSRVVRAVVTRQIVPELINNSSASYTLQTNDLMGVNWTKLHSVVFAEYRPGGTSGAYDMLQAAIPIAPWFAPQPGSMAFLVDAMNPKNQAQIVQMSGSPAIITWNALENIDWLSVTPSSGQAGQSANVQINVSNMARGSYSGSITITAAGLGKNFSKTIPVQVEYTQIWHLFLPLGWK